MTTSLHLTRAKVTLSAVMALLGLAGCAPSFEPESKISAVRVLAVQKDKPYARPGDTVKLRMLLADGSEGGPRPLQVLWLSGCENPLGDLYAGCFADFAKGQGAGSLSAGTGLDFSFTLSKDIISRRPRPADRRQTPYGLAYVFFAACAGEIRFETSVGSTEFPLACYSKGKRLGPSDFVAGYTSVFAYDRLTNGNPIVKGLGLDDQNVTPECVDDACVPLEQREFAASDAGAVVDAGTFGTRDAGSPEAGNLGTLDGGNATPGGDAGLSLPPGGDLCAENSPLCVATCPQEGTCPDHHITLVIDRKSAEPDDVARLRDGSKVTEQMWVNYYGSDKVDMGTAVKLLNDATTGFNEDHGTTFKAPKEAGEFRIWAVAHDNRGGTSWARLRLVAH